MTRALGKGGVASVTALAAALCLLSFFVGFQQPVTADMGICLPSPNLWGLAPWWGWGINMGLLLGTGAGLYFLNKAFSIVPGSQTVLTPFFLLMSASIPWVGGMLTSAALLGPAMLACLAILCSCYRSPNATQEMFVTATLLSIGSMVQYAFIPMIVPVIVIAIIFKCLRIRETLAFILGLIAPYWVAVGLFIIPVEAFELPRLTNIFQGMISPGAFFTGLVNLAVSAILAGILGLYNSVKLYAGNPRRRLFNIAVNVIGISCAVCMAIDFNNFTAYTVAFYFCCAVQLADLFALWNLRRPWIASLLIVGLYTTLYCATLLS